MNIHTGHHTLLGAALMRHGRFRIGIGSLVSIIITVIGCSQGGESNSNNVRRVEQLSNGIELITFSNIPAIELDHDTLAIIDPWSVGVGYFFSRLGGYIVGGDESFCVVDYQNNEIVELGIDGICRNVIGGPGSGPGEFQRLNSIGHLGSEIWATDAALQRISIFNWSGTLLRDFRWPQGMGTTVSNFKVSLDGYFLFHQRTNTRAPEQRYYRLVRFNETSSAPDTILVVEAESAVEVSIELQSGDEWNNYMQPVYSPSLRWSVWKESLITATTLDYQLEYRNTSGEIMGLLKVETPPLEVTSAVKRVWRQEGYKNHVLIQMMTAPDVNLIPSSVDEIPFAAYRSAIIDLEVDPLGRIWVLASTQDPLINRMDIYSWDGHYLGGSSQLTMPRGFLRDGSPIYPFTPEDGASVFIILRLRTEDL